MFIQIRQPIPHLKRKLKLHKFFRRIPASSVGSCKHRYIFIGITLFQTVSDTLDQIQRLLLLIFKISQFHRRSRFFQAPDLFIKALLILPNETTGSLYHRTGRTKIFIQQHHRRPRIILLEIQHNLRFSSPKPVNRLVIVSHNKQILSWLCKHPHYLVLQLVNILKLIHQNVVVMILPLSQNIRALQKKLIAVNQHIVKINEICPGEPLLVFLKHTAKRVFRTTGRIIMLQRNLLIFYQADLTCQIRKKFLLILHIQLHSICNLLKKAVFLFFPQNIGSGIVIGVFQNLKKDSMKCTEGNTVMTASHQPFKPLAHLLSSRFCESDHQNFFRPNSKLFN